MALKLTSAAFEEGKPIPAKHTCEGADVSPPLKWSEAPPGTKSFALICDDPDAPAGTWVHWVLYGLAASATELVEMLREAGFSDVACYGGFDREELTFETRLVLVAG